MALSVSDIVVISVCSFIFAVGVVFIFLWYNSPRFRSFMSFGSTKESWTNYTPPTTSYTSLDSGIEHALPAPIYVER